MITSHPTIRHHTIVDSPVGALTLVASERALVGLYLAADRRRIDRRTFGPRRHTGFEQATEELGEYFGGERTTFDLLLAPVGDAFSQRVWAEVRSIEYGRTKSYGEIARQLGGQSLARAVGSANGRNPISIIIGCHRVVGSDGSLTGYAAGVERKRRLLELESSFSGRQAPAS